MGEGQVKETVEFICPFTGKVVKGVDKPSPVVRLDFNKRDELGLELDKESGNTNVVITGTHDIDKEIQEFEDSCGMEGMRKLISQGRATPRDFYDDGKHGMDVVGLPDNVNDAYRASLASTSEKDKMLNALGLDGSGDVTEERIAAAVEAYFKNLSSKASTNAIKEVNKDETE